MLGIRKGELWDFQWGTGLKFMPQFPQAVFILGDFHTGSMKPRESNAVKGSCWEMRSSDVHQGS